MSQTFRSFICYVGPVYALKSRRVIDEVEGAKIGHRSHIVLKPDGDTRDSRECLETHGHVRYPLAPVHVHSIGDVLERGLQFDDVIIDEGQFFPPDLAGALAALHAQGKRVVYSGLDVDWRCRPWPTTANVLALPEAHVIRLRGTCSNCGSDNASRSQKIAPDQTIVPYDAPDDAVEVGHHYRPVCVSCWHETTPGLPAVLCR